MKRLFRTSKAGTVDPLPPPPPPPHHLSSPPNGQSPAPGQPTGKRSVAGLLSSNGDHAANGAGHHQHHGHDRHRQGSVTPFPIDMGRQTPPPPPPPVNESVAVSPQHGQGRGHKKDKNGMGSAPSLMEIQQMQAQAEAMEKEQRRDQWLSQQRSPTPTQGQPLQPPRLNRQFEVGASPDGWSALSAGAAPPAQAEFGNSSNLTIPAPLLLPPGARPPSPKVRPGTPTRQYHTSVAGDQYSDPYNDPYGQNAPRMGRDRGYSSASGSMRGSDHESSLGHQHKTSVGAHQIPVPKNAQPTGARSPLHNSYANQITPEQISYPSNPHAPQNQYTQLVDSISAIRIEGPSPEVEVSRDSHGKDKEKKKFWGMGVGMNMNMSWGEKKEKDKQKKEADRPYAEEPRRSVEWQRVEERTASSHGHVSTEDESSRGRSLGLSIGGFLRDHQGHQSPAQVDNVTTAIQILCAHPDPPFASTYEVCDRINHSSSPESVGKEATHALRKQFKHGSEAEKRSAANLWLLMMRNVTAKGFRSSATSKKFVAVLEPILLAPPGKAIVSPQTHRLIADILADLTFHFGGEKGSEALGELWRKVKLPQEPDAGVPLSTEFSAFTPENFYSADRTGPAFESHNPIPVQPLRPASPNHQAMYDRSFPPPPIGAPAPYPGGPGYHNLPNHGDDIRRLMHESTAAREAARVLAEALVFTRPEDLDRKPIIKEFYRKCFLAHESLTNQIDWAQAEAAQSRERIIIAASANGVDEAPGMTMEEQALGTLFETHSMLADALKQHDDLERMAVDEMELREVRERSKKDTRMNRNQEVVDGAGGFLAPSRNNAGSSSRSPSPAPHARLPDVNGLTTSPRPIVAVLPMPRPIATGARSRTPSPDRFPRISASPGRASSPLGQSMLAKARGPRPLPNPFSRGQNASSQSLSSMPREAGTEPSRSATGSTMDHSTTQPVDADDEDPPPRTKPSRKALGKRRVVEDPDNHFDPDDMFAEPKKDSSASSEESITADDVFFAKPVKYAYDAYQEKLDNEMAEQRSRAGSTAVGGSGGGSRLAVGAR